MSESINKLEVVTSDQYHAKSVVYKINDKTKISVKHSGIQYDDYIINGGKLIDPKNEPAYGYKLVRNKNNQYIYVRTEDNAVIPYIFDYATNFNENGLAMVAAFGTVTWINKDFKYYCLTGEFKEIEDTKDMDGWKAIFAFAKAGDSMLSKCYAGTSDSKKYTSYLSDDFQTKKFYEYLKSGTLSKYASTTLAGEYSDFNDEGFAFSIDNNGPIISSLGYYMDTSSFIEEIIRTKTEDLLQSAINDGTLTKINEKVKSDKVFQKNRLV